MKFPDIYPKKVANGFVLYDRANNEQVFEQVFSSRSIALRFKPEARLVQDLKRINTE